jgi:hypothetical protein
LAKDHRREEKRREEKRREPLIAWRSGKFITSVLTKFLIWDYKITNFIKKMFNVRLIGLSIYAVCRLDKTEQSAER